MRPLRTDSLSEVILMALYDMLVREVRKVIGRLGRVEEKIAGNLRIN